MTSEIIKTLTTKGSHGYDEISVKILKISSPFIISPQRLKYAEIKPLFMGGCKNDPSNYRPISLLTSFSKTLRRLSCSD
jgi:hypothetical protein